MAANRPDSVVFALGSCQYPAGLLDRQIAQDSLRRLAQRVKDRKPPTPQFLLLAGDQIYADATAGLQDPTNADDRYRRTHDEFLRLEAMKDLQGKIPVYMMLDDHEIQDNWEPFFPSTVLRRHGRLEQGVQAYWIYQRKMPDQPPATPIWFQESGPGWRLFMADSRTCREFRDTASAQTALLLGQAQTSDLETWLTQRPPARDLMVVLTPAMFLPRTRMAQHASLRCDGWDGYPASLYRMLAFLWENDLGNVVFVSGDAHIGCDCRITITKIGAQREVATRSIHAPALYAPFAFANLDPATLLAPLDTFEFSDAGGRYRCEARTRVFSPGNGYCLVTAEPSSSGDWAVTAHRK